MRIGVTMFFQGYQDWERYEARERGEAAAPIDPQVDQKRYEEELDLALRVEDWGFDSLWTVEHHCSPYTMVTNPIQMLSYIAGATKRIDVGTMVAVVPWHHPLRLAEDMVMLQYHLRGRTPYIGFGRGAARREFRMLGIEMGESQERFVEGIEIIKLAIANEVFSYEGKHYKFKDVTMRPRPRDPQALLDNLSFSWGSPSSAPVGARLGLRPLIIPQRPIAGYPAEVATFNAAATQAGYPARRPKVHLNCFVAATHEEAERYATQHIPEYADSAARNYELSSGHFATTKGYEHYAANFDAAKQAGIDMGSVMGMMYVQNHAWGTPDECIEKLSRIADTVNADEFMLVMRYGTMTAEVANKSTELFAKKVLPVMQKYQVKS